MPWCPSCKGEYREGFTFCADCQRDLVDAPPGEAAAPAPDAPQPRAMRPALLCDAGDGTQADMLVALLEGGGIPVLVKRPSAGQYTSIAWGFSITGALLYVDRDDLPRALALAESAGLGEPEEGTEAPLAVPEDMGPFLRRRRFLLAMAVLPPLLVAVGWLVVRLAEGLFGG